MSCAADSLLAVAALYAAARFRRQSLRQDELRELIDAMMYQEIWYDEFLYVLDARARWPDERIVMAHYQLDEWLGFKPNFLSDPADAHEVLKLKAEIVRAAQAWLENRGSEVRH